MNIQKYIYYYIIKDNNTQVSLERSGKKCLKWEEVTKVFEGSKGRRVEGSKGLKGLKGLKLVGWVERL